MNILISSCLLDRPCRYNGTGYPLTTEIQSLKINHTLIPVCPELLGGLPVPRPPVELWQQMAVTADGTDLTHSFLTGARKTLALAQRYQCTHAILKEKSPSCGSASIYDGTFTGTIIPGAGLTTSLLREHGIIVMSESQLKEIHLISP